MVRDGKKGYSSKADVWSVGCIFYELLVGERPFSDDWSVIRYADSKAPLSIPQNVLNDLDSDWEPALTALLNDLLQLDPQSRIPVVDLLRQCAFHYELTCADDSPLYLSYRKYGLPYNVCKGPVSYSSFIGVCPNTSYFTQKGDYNATIW